MIPELKRSIFVKYENKKTDKTVDFYKNLKETWMNYKLSPLLVYYSLLIPSPLASLLIVFVSAGSADLETERTRIILYSIISFFPLIINEIIKPYRLASSYRKAFELLNENLLFGDCYMGNEQVYLRRLAIFVIECERIISRGIY